MELGLHYAVILPFLGFIGFILSLLADLYSREEWGRNLLQAAISFTLLGWVIYVIPFVTLDYRLAEVAKNVNDELPLILRVAASWSGGGSSLYFYTVLIALSTLYVLRARADNRIYRISISAILVTAFLSAMLNGAFDTLPPGYGGFGINPLLKSLWIVPHPLTTFGGYALLLGGSTILLFTPTARRAMTVILAGWGLLTLGITFGAYWSYETLGWGGYWAWDPVEISELTVWLASTTLLHMVGLLDPLRRAAAALTASSALLGPYVTRSGLSPLHSFAAAEIGSLILLVGSLAFLLIFLWEMLVYIERINLGNIREKVLNTDIAIISVGVAGLLIFAMTIFVYSSLLVPGILVAVGKSAEVPSMEEGVRFYNPVLYALFVPAIVFLPGYFLRKDAGSRGVLAYILTTTITATIIAAATYTRRLQLIPEASLTTQLMVAIGLSVSALATGALVASLSARVLSKHRRRRLRKEFRDVLLKLVHIFMLVTFAGVLLSGSFAFNDKYFKTYTLQQGTSVDLGPIEITLDEYGFSPNQGRTDLRVYLENSTIEELALFAVYSFLTDLGNAMQQVQQAEEIVSNNESISTLINTLAKEALSTNETSLTYNGTAGYEYINVRERFSRIFGENLETRMKLKNLTILIDIQPLTIQTGSLAGASLEAVLLPDTLELDAPINWEEALPSHHNYYVISLSEPVKLNITDNITLSISKLELYAGGRMNGTAINITIDNNKTLIMSMPLLRVADGILRIGTFKYNIPASLDLGLYLYLLVKAGNATIIEEALESPLAQALNEFSNVNNSEVALSIPRSVISGSQMWIKLKVNDNGNEDQLLAKIRFEANGEATGIHGLVNPVVHIREGLSDVYIVVVQPVQQGYYGIYHEPLLYYVKILQEQLPPDQALITAAVMAVGYNIPKLQNMPPSQLGLALEQSLVDLYLTAAKFDPENSSIIGNGLVVKVKVVPGVNLVWIGAISMGLLGLISSLISALGAKENP